MDAIIARLREPSTYAGLAAIALATGHAFPVNPEIVNTAVAGFGVLAAILSEKGGFNTSAFLQSITDAILHPNPPAVTVVSPKEPK